MVFWEKADVSWREAYVKNMFSIFLDVITAKQKDKVESRKQDFCALFSVDL